MPFNVDSVQPTGGMNKDIDLSLVPKGDYLDALNVTHVPEEGSTGYAIQNTKGNVFRFNIPPNTSQPKIYAITLFESAATAREITFYNTAGDVWFTVNWVDDPVWANTYTNFTAALAIAMAAAVPVAILGSVTSADPIAIFEYGNYYDFSIRSTQATNDTPILVIQEAVPISGVSSNIIGSYDLLGDLFIWSTTQNEMPEAITAVITGATNPASPAPIVLTTDIDHDLAVGMEILVQGVEGQTGANGIWLISDIPALNQIELYNSLGTGAYTSGGTITINITAVGEIGVAKYDINTDTTAYTKLVASKAFNFRTAKQIDTYCEANNFQQSLYWTDDYNVPRVLYYRGPFSPYLANGAIEYYNTLGLYDYDTIADETKLILTNELIGFTFIGQIQSGGAVNSGNWRYAVRLTTSSFSATNWTDLSNPINVFLADTGGDATEICGDDSGVVTSKINQFSLSNLPVGVFQYVELAAVNYVDNVIVGYNIIRVAITSEDMIIEHSGNEINTTNLDVATLNQFNASIATAKNIDAIDNRLILSNLTAAQRIDFSAFALTIEHSLLQQEIDDIGLSGYSPSQQAFGEYQDPLNVYNYAGYMLNDTYRFGVKFRMKSTGEFTNVFYVDDIRFDDSATNISIPDRRVAGLPNMNLTNAGAFAQVLVPYVRFSNIDLDYHIDGVPIRNLVSSIHFERVERVKEVLVSGVVAMTVTGTNLGVAYGAGVGTNYGEYTQIGGYSGSHVAYPDTFTAYRKAAKLYAPDIHCGHTNLSFILGDEIINFGNAESASFLTGALVGNIFSGLTEYNGLFTSTVTSDLLTSGNQLGNHASPFLLPTSGFNYNQELNENPIVVGSFWELRSGFVIETTNNLVTTGANTDYGLYNAQYFRGRSYDPNNPDNSKYGRVAENIYIPTGAFYDIGVTSGIITQDVFGGDVFTQKTYLMHRAGGAIAPVDGGGGGIGYYSQNSVNAQMIRKYSNAVTSWNYPNAVTLGNWLYSSNLGDATAPYNEGYNIVNGVSRNVGFDSSLPDQSDLPTQIRYSELKPQNSVMDNFRVFLPLNFKDLPLTFGEITHHANYNGELFTWQPRMVQRQYFNTRGEIQVAGANTAAVIGDGSVFSRDGQMVSVIGTYHKWSVIKGKSAQGNDTFYWINTELKKIMRMGYDGTIIVSDIQGMQSFIANNLKWVAGKDTPADGQGICGVWDDRYLEAMWTVRGIRETGEEWSDVANYVIGDLIFLSTGSSVFEGTSDFYVAIQDGVGQLPDLEPTYWTLIPHSGSVVINGVTYNASDYYNEYTLAFNEQKNKFTTFYTFKPKIYLKWTDTFLTPRPVFDTGNVYEHRLGDYCKWYDQSGDSQEEDGYIELIYNQGVNVSKSYRSLWLASLITPKRLDLYTKNQQSFNIDTDAENINDYYAVPVKNDILTSSTGLLNDEDTSGLFGQNIKIKITFEKLIFQKIVDVIVKFVTQNRLFNK